MTMESLGVFCVWELAEFVMSEKRIRARRPRPGGRKSSRSGRVSRGQSRSVEKGVDVATGVVLGGEGAHAVDRLKRRDHMFQLIAIREMMAVIDASVAQLVQAVEAADSLVDQRRGELQRHRADRFGKAAQ